LLVYKDCEKEIFNDYYLLFYQGNSTVALTVFQMVPTPYFCVLFIEHNFDLLRRVGGGRINLQIVQRGVPSQKNSITVGINKVEIKK